MSITGATLLTLLLIGPGILGVLMLSRGRELRCEVAFTSALVVGIAGLVIASLIGLVVSNLGTSLVIYGGLATTALAWRLIAFDSQGDKAGVIRWERKDAFGFLIALVPMLLLVSPGWNFLMAHNMDAGNYEVVSTHYAISESYWYDVSDAMELESVEYSWLAEPGNTWWAPQGQLDLHRQYYLPGYPVLLGTAKWLSGTQDRAWLLNVGLGVTSLLILYQIGRSQGLSRRLALLATTASSLTLLFLYYSKQLMAEQLGLLGFSAVVWGVLDRRLPVRLAALVSASGSLILMLTKLDGIRPLFIVLGFVMLLGLASYRMRVLGTAILAGASLAGASISILAVPSYLRHARLPGAESLGIDLSGRGFIATSLGLLSLLCAGTWVLYGRAPVRRVGVRLAAIMRTQRFRGSMLAILVPISIWLLIVRPLISDFELGHDPFNAVRLALVWSPALLLLCLSGLAFISPRGSTGSRVVGAALLIALIMALITSYHSAPDLWWMRRYLTVVMPLSILSFVGLVAWIKSVRWRSKSILRRAAGTILVVSIAFQVFYLAPLFRERQNHGLNLTVASIAESNDHAPLFVAAAGRPYVGVGNAVRSLRSGPTFTAVPSAEIPTLLVSHHEHGAMSLVPSDLVPSLGEDFDLKVIDSGVAEGDWANWHRNLGDDRSPRRRLEWSLITAMDDE